MDGGTPIPPIGVQLPIGQVPPPPPQQHQHQQIGLLPSAMPPQQLPLGPIQVPAGPSQLPPQMFTTATQLLDLTDKKLLVLLRDGRKLIGVLRTWDQYANLVLQSAIERVVVDDMYHDIKRGVYIVRGENVLLLGEIDLDKEDDVPFRHVPYEEIFAKQQAQIAQQKQKEKNKKKRMLTLGFEPEQEQLV